MALDFPTPPTNGQQYQGYTYSSSVGAWQINSNAVAPAYMSDTPPTAPSNGTMWFNTQDATLYFYYNDGSSSQWVEARAPITSDGYNSPNYVINGGFDIWQRGTSITVTDGQYGPDRWRRVGNGAGGTIAFSQQTFTPGTAPVAGYESAYFCRYACTVAPTGQTYHQIQQPIEDVRTLAGQSATVSFWAKTTSGTQAISVNTHQYFGSGGSADVETTPISATLTTSWQRFTFTFNIASISGKTIGTNHWLGIQVNVPQNATSTLDIWGVQVEAGTAATTFRRNANSLQGELAACQRYYWSTNRASATGDSLPGSAGIQAGYIVASIPFPVPMRVAPGASNWSTANVKFRRFSDANTYVANTATMGGSSINSAWVYWTVTGATAGDSGFLITNAAGGYFDFSAEL